MGRQFLFALSLAEMVAIGGLFTVAIFHFVFMITLEEIIKDTNGSASGVIDANNSEEKVDPQGSAFINRQNRILIVTLIEQTFMLAANLFLIFATKDENETPIRRKMNFLNVSSVILFIYILKNAVTLMKPSFLSVEPLETVDFQGVMQVIVGKSVVLFFISSYMKTLQQKLIHDQKKCEQRIIV